MSGYEEYEEEESRKEFKSKMDNAKKLRMDNLRRLRAANVYRDAEWDPDKLITPLFRAVEFGEEAGEVLGVIKKLERENMGLRGSRKTIEDLGEEIADCLITLDLLAMTYGIDLWNQVVNKFNITSEHHNLLTRLEP